jgi:hypothetical protein
LVDTPRIRAPERDTRPANAVPKGFDNFRFRFDAAAAWHHIRDEKGRHDFLIPTKISTAQRGQLNEDHDI